MKGRRRLLAAGLLGSALTPLHAQAPNAARDDAGTEADAAAAALLQARLRAEGVSLASARFGASGPMRLAAASKEGAAAVSADRHRFEIGSITKVFVGVLLAEATLRRELSLDGAVEQQLGQPLRDAAGQALRYVDLATHRSGLPRLPSNLRPARESDPYVDHGEQAQFEALRQLRPTRRRDEAFEYSNWGFGLLGWLLARRAGLSFEALMQQRLLSPLGLAPGDTPALAQGHDAQGRPVPHWSFSPAMAGAGALRLTAAQLARFGQVVLGTDDHPLREAIRLSLQVHSTVGPGPGAQMGLGWMLLSGPGGRVATHDGGTAGAASSLWVDLGQRRGAIVLANAAVPVTDLARHLMDERAPLRDVAAERRSASQPAIKLDDARLAELAGVYAASPQFSITVRARGGQLFAQATGQGEFELFAREARRFFARVAALEVAFDGDAGAPPSLVVHQAGQQTRFRRVGNEPADVTLPAQDLQPLAGVYALNPDFKLSVRAEGTRLYAQATGQGEFELFAQADGSFIARVTPLTIHFEPGRPAPSLRLQQAGRETRFTRE